MSLDYSKLRGKIKEVFGTQAKLAEELGISNACLSNKLNEKSDFTHSEIIRLCEMLGVPDEEINAYFFCRAS